MLDQGHGVKDQGHIIITVMVIITIILIVIVKYACADMQKDEARRAGLERRHGAPRGRTVNKGHLLFSSISCACSGTRFSPGAG